MSVIFQIQILMAGMFKGTKVQKLNIKNKMTELQNLDAVFKT